MIAAVVQAIRAHRYRYANEDDLQEALYRMLRGEGFRPKREVRLAPRDRVDLMVGHVAIEVKVDGRLRDVELQLRRYADCRDVNALVLVTTRITHLDVPRELNGKPVQVVSLLAQGALA